MMAGGKRSKGRRASSPRRRTVARRRGTGPAEVGETTPLLDERAAHTESTPALTGGDVDADWQRAGSTGEEAVGGSVVTPDQDVVDELGRALGVEQESDAEVRTSEEILRSRDRDYWELEREATEREDRE